MLTSALRISCSELKLKMLWWAVEEVPRHHPFAPLQGWSHVDRFWQISHRKFSLHRAYGPAVHKVCGILHSHSGCCSSLSPHQERCMHLCEVICVRTARLLCVGCWFLVDRLNCGYFYFLLWSISSKPVEVVTCVTDHQLWLKTLSQCSHNWGADTSPESLKAHLL